MAGNGGTRQSGPAQRCDVIVVGGGSAAFEAAVAAREAGAEHVVMLEKAPEPEFGGNARYSHTGFRVVHAGASELREFLRDVDAATFARMDLPAYTAADFDRDLHQVTLGRINHDLAAVLVGDSNAAAHWMLDLGITWETTSQRIVDGRIYFDPGFILSPTGGGLGQLLRWRELALARKVDLRYDSAVSFLHGNDRLVEGVRVSDAEGEYDISAEAIILCSGGFQASVEKRARYLGRNADLMKVRGSKHDTGEVLMAAINLGAASAGQWQGAHATAIDATFPDVEASNKANRYSYPYGITVNRLAERFFDEGEAEITYTYARTGWQTLEQPGSVAFQIFDQQGLPYLKTGFYKHATPVEAQTIGELAGKLGIVPLLLERTVAEFNRAVRDDIPFDASRRDGRHTEGIQPPKTNWATRIDQPPYVAFPITGGITFTFGGLAVNPDAQVLNTTGRPIRGLYASGDIVGLFFHNYPAASGQTRNVVFSRRAGRAAVRNASALDGVLAQC